MAEKVAILKLDLQGEKLPGKITSALGRVINIGGNVTTHRVNRGELLVSLRSIKEGHPNYRVKRDPSIVLYCAPSDVASLVDPREVNFLEGIQSCSARYVLFSEGESGHGRLQWALGLALEKEVYLKIPAQPTPICTVATIRYIGEITGLPGWQFGVEIMDDVHHGKGTTNGSVGDQQYFTCRDKAGLFVSLDKISPELFTFHFNSQPPRMRSNTFTVLERIPDYQFKMNERVMVYNKKGEQMFGRVCWCGDKKRFGFMVVGIEMESEIFVTDFEGSIGGVPVEHGVRPRHWLVLPETMVNCTKWKPQKPLSPKCDEPVTNCSGPSWLTSEFEEFLKEAVKQSQDVQGSGRTPVRQMTSVGRVVQPKKHELAIDNSNPYNLAVGSPVQLALADPSQPPRYGVIRWIGEIAGAEGKIAGVKLDEYMEGCTDGTLQSTGQIFFHCQLGHGLYYPLKSLCPDERFISSRATASTAQKILHQEGRQAKEIAALREQKIAAEKILETTQQELELCKLLLSTCQSELSSCKKELAERTTELSSCKKELAACTIDVWRVSPQRAQATEMIGYGGWGTVSKGRLEVAIKKLHPIIMSPQNLARIQREIQLLGELRHPNLVQFIGAVFDEEAGVNQTPLIITELLDMNLRQVYEQNQLRAGDRLSIFIDTARALDYLHQRYEPIIHRDVSAPNVLLQRMPNNQWRGKLSDLGSANFLQQAQTMGEGCILCTVPEVIPRAYSPRQERTPQTTKIDVYSYGVLLCEVIAGKLPSQDDYYNMLETVLTQWPQLHTLIVKCTLEKPEDRPAMVSILVQLRENEKPRP